MSFPIKLCFLLHNQSSVPLLPAPARLCVRAWCGGLSILERRCKLFKHHLKETPTIMTTRTFFMKHIADRSVISNHKVSIVGCGNVGMAVATCLLSGHIADELVIVDKNENKVKGEVLDLQQSSVFTPGAQISGGIDYSETANSKVCIIAAGANTKPGQSPLELVHDNLPVLKDIVPSLLKYSPDTILLVVSDPVDILTYVAWKISGRPINTVFGTGTSLDTGRLQYLIAQELGLNISAVNAWIIGEHGDSSVPVWSHLQIAGVKLKEIEHSSKIKMTERLDELHKMVVTSESNIVKLKGFTSWAIGFNTAGICKSILNNLNNVRPVSTLVQGNHGVEEEIFLSLPCVIGLSGITELIPLELEKKEQEMFRKAAKTLIEVASKLKI